jgi:hypothetical protein
MPKKMGINTKAAEARERKEAVKVEATKKAQKLAEDALWADDDKKLAKKKQLKVSSSIDCGFPKFQSIELTDTLCLQEEEERKKAEQLRKKQEAKTLLEQEMNSIKTGPKLPIAKVTRMQIQQENEKRHQAIERLTHPPKEKTQKVVPLEENLNRVMADTEVAQTVEQAIAVLSVKDEEDKHPEKRMKAAFKAYESENLPRLKNENPTLKLSQLKQMVFKDWQKSPQNPMNQRT